MNSVNLIGRLGRNPELKDYDGFKVCNFSVAVNNGYMKDGEWVDRTEWIRCEVKNDAAVRFADKCVSGNLLSVQGKLVTREYTPAGAEKPVTLLNVHVLRVHKLAGADSESQKAAGVEKDNEDALPF